MHHHIYSKNFRLQPHPFDFLSCLNQYFDDVQKQVQPLKSQSGDYIIAVNNVPLDSPVSPLDETKKIASTFAYISEIKDAIKVLRHEYSKLIEDFNEKQKENSKRIIKSLISSRSIANAGNDDAESRVDYLSDMLGIPKEDVVTSINMMRQEGLLADSMDMSAYILKTDSENRSEQILNRFAKLEEFLLRHIEEQGSDFSLKELNEAATNAGVAYSSVKNIRTLLYYLTIKGYEKEFGIYKLGFPNEEVREGFIKYLMPFYTSVSNVDTGLNVQNFVLDLRAGNIDGFMKRLKSLFSNTPYELVKDLENHYQNVMYIVSQLCGIYTRAEYHTSEGRIDMTMETSDYVYIWEFKFEKSAQEALDQIVEKHYADPFKASGKKIVCIGVNFSHAIRGIDEYLVKEVE